jgi:hypothetical protein
MTYVLKESTRAVLTMTEVTAFRRMPSLPAALLLIQKNRPDLDREAQEDILLLVEDAIKSRVFSLVKTTTNKIPPNMSRSIFLAAAWINGASWGQLGSIFGVSRQTLMRSVERILPPDNRQALRLRNHVAFEQVSEMHDKFKNIVNDLPEGISILDLAKSIWPDEGSSIWEVPNSTQAQEDV